jgi:hypothetical protein
MCCCISANLSLKPIAILINSQSKIAAIVFTILKKYARISSSTNGFITIQLKIINVSISLNFGWQ